MCSSRCRLCDFVVGGAVVVEGVVVVVDCGS